MGRHLGFGCLALLALALGCSPGPSPEPPPLAEPSQAEALSGEFRKQIDQLNTKTGAEQISVEALSERIAAGKPVVILDIREAPEQRVGALPGAQWLPPGQVDGAELTIPEGAEVVCYCTIGYRSGVAAVALARRLGRPVKNLDGGLIAWFNHGGEVVGPDGEPVNTIHAWGPAWARFVKRRDGVPATVHSSSASEATSEPSSASE